VQPNAGIGEAVVDDFEAFERRGINRVDGLIRSG